MDTIVPVATEFTSFLPVLSELFTTENLLAIILAAILLMFILYIYIFFRGWKWILKWYGAQKIQRNERALLYSILEELSKKAGVPTPEIFSFESEIPAIFTVGSGRKSFIAISKPTLKMFDEMKLEVLLAHEIGHIKNNNVGLNTVTAFLAGLIMSIPNFVMWIPLLAGFGQPKDPVPKFFKFVATALTAPPAATLIHLTNPAKRETKADEIAIKLTENPQTLAKTLELLENYIPLQPVADKFNPGHFHLFSTHTQQIGRCMPIFISLFDMHPRIENRITHILKYSNDLENGSFYNRNSRVAEFFDLRSWRLALAASLISYLSFLLVIIVVIAVTVKGFTFQDIGIIAGAYIGAVMIFIGITARLSRRGHHLK